MHEQIDYVFRTLGDQDEYLPNKSCMNEPS